MEVKSERTVNNENYINVNILLARGDCINAEVSF